MGQTKVFLKRTFSKWLFPPLLRQLEVSAISQSWKWGEVGMWGELMMAKRQKLAGDTAQG